MQNSSISSPTSNSIVAKLLEVDADLAVTEVQLAAQLQSIQEKRHSLKNVISLFPPVNTAAPTPVETSTPELVEKLAEPLAPEVATPELEDTTIDTTEAAPSTQKRQGRKNSSSTSKSNKKSAPTREASKEADTWQQYVKDEFSNAPLAEAVAQVMQQQEGQVLEITTIIDAIFTNKIPKELRSKARERVSNVLSVGTKSGKWYRGQLGKYSMSKAAVVDDLIT
ncbi:hypothetical protein [Chlorogloea sp. CCALA 695]|uniref:hypothetical protein n=1 Tax=Chlorogloea sp. CCALA 695 TaxID=2107693 RepID=UPI000D074EF1|nr:hypothetical protein [Chlorogloea sp. CCALA 695]PSB28830.1 hypothetical protein C7B70_19945 [Chlorogloea sp. CCALA 695]